MKAVFVEWEDACSRDLGPWVDKQDWTWDTRIVHEVGFLIYDGEEGIILTSAYHDFATGPISQIPRGMIRKITPI